MIAKIGNVFNQDDRDALMSEVKRLDAKTVLEFGPGFSTWAFIDAGCTLIDSFEHNDGWLAKSKALFAKQGVVRIGRYTNTAEAPVEFTRPFVYNLAYVDSPRGGRRGVPLPGQEGCSRFNTLKRAISCARVVLLHDAKRDGEQESLRRVKEMGRTVEMIDTEAGIARII